MSEAPPVTADLLARPADIPEACWETQLRLAAALIERVPATDLDPRIAEDVASGRDPEMGPSGIRGSIMVGLPAGGPVLAGRA